MFDIKKVTCTCGARLRSPVIGEVWVNDYNGAYYVVESDPTVGTAPWWGARRLDVIGKQYGCDPSACVAIWPTAIREQRWAWFAESVEAALAKLRQQGSSTSP